MTLRNVETFNDRILGVINLGHLNYLETKVKA